MLAVLRPTAACTQLNANNTTQERLLTAIATCSYAAAYGLQSFQRVQLAAWRSTCQERPLSGLSNVARNAELSDCEEIGSLHLAREMLQAVPHTCLWSRPRLNNY